LTLLKSSSVTSSLPLVSSAPEAPPEVGPAFFCAATFFSSVVGSTLPPVFFSSVTIFINAVSDVRALASGAIGGFSFTNGSSSFYSGTTKLTTLTGTSPLGVGQGYNILTDGAGASGGWKTRLDGGFHIANNSNPQVGNDFCNYGSNAIVGGSITATNGFSSLASNTLALASITFPASAANWTNTFGKTIFVFIDNLGVTGTVVKINGTQVFSGLANDITLPLQSGEYFSETYTVGTPTATWKPF